MFTAKKFNIPKLEGISEKTIEEHLKLYEGYVKNANEVIGQDFRRFSFEFDGMRNHENYFENLEDGAVAPNSESDLNKMISAQWESFEKWFETFKTLATTRGIGWAILYFDPISEKLLNAWIDEQHLGHLAGCNLVLALDMWEHSYVADYFPSGKKKYIEDYFKNLNWSKVEQRFAKLLNK